MADGFKADDEVTAAVFDADGNLVNSDLSIAQLRRAYGDRLVEDADGTVRLLPLQERDLEPQRR